VIESFEISDLLLKLVDRSLVSYDEDSGRFSLLETVRQYSAEHALNVGDSAALREHHLAYFQELTRDSQQKVRGPKQAYWLKRFDDEYDNIRIALDWVLSDPSRWPEAVDLAYELVDYWMVRSAYSESGGIIKRLEPNADSAAPIDRVKFRMVEQATHYFVSRPDPKAMIDAAKIALEQGHEHLHSNALGNLTIAYVRNGMFDEALATADQAFAALDVAGNWTMAAFVHMNLGNQALARNMLDVAGSHYKEALRIRSEHGDLRGIGASTGAFAELAQLEGNIEEAIKLHRQALSIFLLVGSQWDIAGSLPGSALELYENGRFEDAAVLIGFADQLLKTLGATLDEADGKIYELMVSKLKSAMDSESYKIAYKKGSRLTMKAMMNMLYPDGLDIPEEYLPLLQGAENSATA